jgi:hypothetical protein
MSELDDDRQENASPDSNADDSGDPAAAFDALRHTVEGLAGDLTREMTTIRKGVERALDEFERIGPAQNYSGELAQIVQQLATVAKRLEGVEQSPVLRQGPEHYAAALKRGGEQLIGGAAKTLERQASDLERAGAKLAVWTKSAYDRQSQNYRMWIAGVVGVIVGILLVVLLPRILPASVGMGLVSIVMGESRWQAGMQLMSDADPTTWQRVVAADKLIDANKDVVAACREAVAKIGKEQKCTISVPGPEKR